MGWGVGGGSWEVSVEMKIQRKSDWLNVIRRLG